MIELAKHIEYLLLENDCVIVPGLGGFIAHFQSAHYEESEDLFYPPTRTVGFNPQLTMNDGLLAQLYMQVYHTDFSDANRKIADAVSNLKETLYEEGVVDMPGVGALHYTISNTYEFHPAESGVISPFLYGLDSFRMQKLGELREELPLPESHEESEAVALPEKKYKEIRLNPNWWSHAVAVAVAAVLFFALSVPVENTYVDKGSYASLGTDCLFDAIRSNSMAMTLVSSEQQTKKSRQLQPVTVKVEKVAVQAPKQESSKNIEHKVVKEAPKAKEKANNAKAVKSENTVKTEKAVKQTASASPKATTPQPSAPRKTGSNYHIIVASLPTDADAQQMLKEYRKQGYAGTEVVKGGGRFRISLCSYSDKAEAYRKLGELKKEDAFKSAWMLTSK